MVAQFTCLNAYSTSVLYQLIASPPWSSINVVSSTVWFGNAFNASHTRERLSRNSDTGMAYVPGPILIVCSSAIIDFCRSAAFLCVEFVVLFDFATDQARIYCEFSTSGFYSALCLDLFKKQTKWNQKNGKSPEKRNKKTIKMIEKIFRYRRYRFLALIMNNKWLFVPFSYFPY